MSRRLRAFKRWMNSNGIVYTDALEFVDSPIDGISVRAVCKLKEGDLVATIPKQSCLTIRTSGIASLIEAAGLGGCLGLAVALMYERSLGAASPWEGYLQLLLEKECVPLVWTLEEVDNLLVGTELHKIVKEDKKFLYEDWKEFIEPLVQSLRLEVAHDSFGVDQYFAAKSLVSSRSFEIDEYHGFGMVPLADMFNHKTGAEHIHFTSVSYSNSDDEEDDGEILDASADGLTSSLGNVPNPPLEIILVRDVEAGDEIFNTYGSMGNAAMLHRYGFTESDNPFDIVNINIELVLQCCSSLFSNRHLRARLLTWRKLNYSGCTTRDSEYFEVAFDGEPQTELLILLHIIFLSEYAHQKAKCAADSLAAADDDTKLIQLLEITETKCDPKSKFIGPKEMLLTEHVCWVLGSLSRIRDGSYGSTSLEEDVRRLQRCCAVKERKLYHALVLRIGERQVLRRLRAYTSKHLRKRKRGRTKAFRRY